MRSIQKKLMSRSGASLIIALMFFLICAMIASAVVYAATATAGKTAKRREEQTSYFSMISAIKLIGSDIANPEGALLGSALNAMIDEGEENGTFTLSAEGMDDVAIEVQIRSSAKIILLLHGTDAEKYAFRLTLNAEDGTLLPPDLRWNITKIEKGTS